jgi:AraC-like DNA-binding protein
MADFDAHCLVTGDTVAVWDVVCRGGRAHESDEECSTRTHLVFPYRGVYVHHVGRTESVAEANQVIFINKDEPYRVSHPVDGGDSTLSIGVSEAALRELAPKEYFRDGYGTFNRSRLRIGAGAQTLTASLRHSLDRGAIEKLEAESLALALVRTALGERTPHAAAAGAGPRKLVDRAKLVLVSDLSRRWALAEIASAVGGSPVYLTQVFQRLEGMPLYRYQLQLRGQRLGRRQRAYGGRRRREGGRDFKRGGVLGARRPGRRQP